MATPVALVFLFVAGSTANAAIPRASDYHALLVLPSDSKTLLLGTHNGIFRSDDAGRSWRPGGLAGEDAMNLVLSGQTVLVGGHNVFAESANEGRTWRHFRPAGLPSLDVHGLAVDPRRPNVVYAQIADTGLYRSTDGGFSFRLVSSDVNGAMMQVAVSPSGRLVIADMSRGIWLSSTGKKWLHTATGMAMGIAVDPQNANRIIATGRGIAISNDGGRSWAPALALKVMFGPVAFAPHNPNLVYAVGYNRTFWRSTDAGKTWKKVA